jgi:hypothetical protein
MKTQIEAQKEKTQWILLLNRLIAWHELNALVHPEEATHHGAEKLRLRHIRKLALYCTGD